MKNNQFTVIQYLLYNTDNNRQAYIIKYTYSQVITRRSNDSFNSYFSLLYKH